MDKEQIIGSVRSQDLSVSWISEPGADKKDTDRVCILMMANGQVRLTMQSATLDLKGMRLTKGHICVFALFEPNGPGNGEAADKVSETFMNMIMRYDITKKPAAAVLKKCLSKADKSIRKQFRDASYKASVAAFAAKDLTVCCMNGGRMFISSAGKVIEFTSEGTDILSAGQAWDSVMMISGGYPLVTDEIKDDMRSPMGDLIVKRELKLLPVAASMIRVHRI